MELTETKPWPVDIEALKKGDVIPASVVVEWSRVPVTSRNYPIEAMKLRGYIERKLPGLTVISENDNLRILTDEEASLYLAKSQKQRIHGLYKDHHRLLAVDKEQIQGKEAHERRLMASSFITGAMVNARKQIRLIMHKKT